MLESAETHCPYCGERIELEADGSAGARDYIEDCPVCCRPIAVRLTVDAHGFPHIEARRDDE